MRPLALLALFLPLCTALPAQAGDAAPELALRGLQGEAVQLSALRGRIVVLNFWATWCTPCREEMPMLSRVQAEYADRAVVVVGASTDDASTEAHVRPFLQSHGIDFAIWLGAGTADMRRFGLGTALPATAVIAPDGTVAGRILGPLEESDLRHRLDWLLGERSGDAPAPLVDNIEKALREHEEESGHRHGGVALEGASSVPS